MVRLRDIWQALYPYAVFRTGKAVYLTFDDGPIPEVTPQVLEILERYRVKATFFMVGENIDKHPEVFRMVLKGGHAVGNHTYNHLKGWSTSFRDYMDNVAKWENTFNRQPIVNRQSSNHQFFRPPYGKATWRQRRALVQRGYRLIYWDVLTRDYDASVSAADIMATIRRDTCPGSIINFHDSLKSAERTLAVLPQAIEWLQAQGYELTLIN